MKPSDGAALFAVCEPAGGEPPDGCDGWPPVAEWSVGAAARPASLEVGPESSDAAAATTGS